MKYAVAVVVALLFVVVCGAEEAVEYAGTSKGGPTFNPPSWDSSGVCTTATGDPVPYVVFNYTFPTAGVRQVSAMAENTFKTSLRVHIYRGTFTPATPCAGVLPQVKKTFDLDGGPVLDQPVHFLAEIYFFVVTGTSSTSAGIFAAHITPCDVTGTTTAVAGPNFWKYPTIGSSGTCSDSSTPVPYAWYTWTQPATGRYDIYTLWENNTVDSSWYTYMALYTGNASAAGLATDACNVTGADLYYTSYASAKATYIPYAELTAGRIYTVVFSGSEPEHVGYWGVQVIPTRVRFQKGGAGKLWTQPERGQTDCEASSYTGTSWDATTFETKQRAYLIDTAEPPPPFQYFDTYCFLYKGYNLGGADGSPPATCPLFAPLVIGGDTGDVTPVYSITDPGVNYTTVCSTYSNADRSPTADTDYAYVLYLFTGLPIGSLPVSTTGTPTTGGATTGMATTGMATGMATTSTPATTGTPSSTTTPNSGGKTSQPSSTTSAASTTKVMYYAVTLLFIVAALF